jgi:hypothetical protein
MDGHFRKEVKSENGGETEYASVLPSLRAVPQIPERWLSGRKQRFAKPIQPLMQVQENTKHPLASQLLAPFLISPDFL